MKRLLVLLSLLGTTLAASAASIVWASDNGVEGTVADAQGTTMGAWYGPVSTNGTPFVDQGFVDMLTAAGHTGTRFNPTSGTLSTNDIAQINRFDLIILGAALNSGPFNFGGRPINWNVAITTPMIVTKSTLIRRDRMGFLTNNLEYDCASDASTTASGKWKLQYPDSPLFKGIVHTNAGGSRVMTNYANIRVAQPPNNRSTSAQFYKLLVNGVEQSVTNAVEPGGTVLATIEFNPLDPGVNIPTGQAPAVDGNYLVTGFAAVEWPAGTAVRSTQTTATPPNLNGPEPLAGYRLFIGCGTRDASGTATGAPNPLVGAMDLSVDGQKIFMNGVDLALRPPFKIVSVTRPGSDVTLTWNARYARFYSIWAGTNVLSTTNWTRVSGPTGASGDGVKAVTLTGQAASYQFYQVRWE